MRKERMFDQAPLFHARSHPARRGRISMGLQLIEEAHISLRRPRLAWYD